MALTDGLVAYYKLDGNSNDIFGNNGTDTNITYSAANGKLIQGAGFNGTSSYIVTGSNMDLSSTNVVTVSLWTNADTSVGTKILFQHSINADANNAFIIYKSGDAAVGYMQKSGSYNGFQQSGTNNGTFKHWVFVFNRNNSGSAQTKMYINGVSTGSSIFSATITGNFGTFKSYFGSVGGSSLWFDKAVDEVGVWSRELSADEVKDLYLNGNGSQYPFRDKGFLMM